MPIQVITPEPAPNRDIDRELNDYVTLHLRAGFRTPREIAKFAAHYLELKPAECRRRVAAITPGIIRKLRKEQRSWPPVTDCDRLDRAFADLEQHGILARQNYYCCGTCGAAAIDDEMRRHSRKPRRGRPRASPPTSKPVRGYTFLDEQDTDAAAAGGPLTLNYGHNPGAGPWSERAAIAIGREVARALRARGLRVQWNGRIDTRLVVRLKWRKRLRD